MPIDYDDSIWRMCVDAGWNDECNSDENMLLLYNIRSRQPMYKQIPLSLMEWYLKEFKLNRKQERK